MSLHDKVFFLVLSTHLLQYLDCLYQDHVYRNILEYQEPIPMLGVTKRLLLIIRFI